MKLAILAASMATALCAAAPANAAYFDFDAAHPTTLMTGAAYFDFSFLLQSLGVNGQQGTAADAVINVVGQFTYPHGGGTAHQPYFTGVATSGAATAYMAYPNLPPDLDYQRQYITFSTTSDQTIRVSDLTGMEVVLHGNPQPITFSILPEPGTWLMMFAGFAMIGAATRYRVRSVKAYS